MPNKEVFLFAVARWGQRNCRRCSTLTDSQLRVSIRCREMGTAEHLAKWKEVRREFLFAVARWGQRNGRPVRDRHHLCGFYSLSRDGDSGTLALLRRVCQLEVFLFAVARWGQRNRTRISRALRGADPRFYSLSRDGDSGTRSLCTSMVSRWTFLFAVARWGQRNTLDGNWLHRCHHHGFYSLSRDGDSGTRARRVGALLCRRAFLFAVARWGQRNWPRLSASSRSCVSIRCREMGTAEPVGALTPSD